MTSRNATVEHLAALIRDATGNLVPPARLGFLGEVAERRAAAAGLPGPADYVRALAAGELPREWQSLVSLITIKESYFFRAPQQFEVIARQVLPRLLRARAAPRRLRIWSAACARGEEPATLAMVLAEEPALAGWDWSILATDLDEEALAGARRGLYGERAVAQVPPPLLARCFQRRGKLFQLVPEILARIDYRALNLADPPYPLPSSEYDLILLRNVLIYFTRPLQARVMAYVAQLLSRKGLLFLGASETLWQIQDELEAVDLGTCYAYRHRRLPRMAAHAAAPMAAPAAGEPARAAAAAVEPHAPAAVEPHAPAAAAVPAAPTPDAASPTAATPAADAPAAAMASGRRARRASEVSTATAETAGPPADTGAPRAAATAAGGGSTEAAPAGIAPHLRSAAELLLAATRELAADRPDSARQRLDEALAADPSEPAGHALDGFLHDLGGRLEEAVAAYRAALYLDPSLFQPRLLLAGCLLRLGQRDRAEHQFREVLAALDSRRERPLAIFHLLPLPDRDQALRRCRQALNAAP
jgi:chemotaxis protein methyltransferase CheR